MKLPNLVDLLGQPEKISLQYIQTCTTLFSWKKKHGEFERRPRKTNIGLKFVVVRWPCKQYQISCPSKATTKPGLQYLQLCTRFIFREVKYGELDKT